VDGVARNLGTLAALLGRTRAAILRSVTLLRSTSDLAAELNQSTAAITAHLGELRRSGLVTSWRAGRRVLYQRTPLASGVLVASATAAMPRRRAVPRFA
jgi:biotin operon repressor